MINNSYHVWFSTDDDKIGDLPGWKSAQNPEDYTLQELGFVELLERGIPHAFPIPKSPTVSQFHPTTWEPFIYSRVQTARFLFCRDTASVMDSGKTGIGFLWPDYDDRERKYPGTNVRPCTLIAVCEATFPGSGNQKTGDGDTKDLASQHVAPLKPYRRVDVLWIEWKGQIAFRRGVGGVQLDAWEKASPTEIDIILG